MQEMTMDEIEQVNGALAPAVIWFEIDGLIWAYDIYLISKMY